MQYKTAGNPAVLKYGNNTEIHIVTKYILFFG